MSGHIHGTVEKRLIPVSTAPVQERRWIKAATAQTIPVMKRDVTGKYLGQMRNAAAIKMLHIHQAVHQLIQDIHIHILVRAGILPVK